jgi:peptidyl-prolyl cis-trans isomerase SurA
MKRVLAGLILLLVAVFGLAPARAQSSQNQQVVNAIAAIVNEKVITMKDVYQSAREEAEFIERRYGRNAKERDERINALLAERTEELIERELILNEFKTLGHPLPDSYIENRIADDIKKSGDRLTLIKTLQAEGITYESYRDRVKENTIARLMWNAKVPQDPVISPTKIENYYVDHQDKFKAEDRVKLRMIVLTNAASAGLAKEIVQKLDDGAPFEDMAKIYSQDSSASDGGDKGWLDRKTLREELGNVAFGMPAGKRSDPISLGGTIFIMKVEANEPAHVRSLTEVRQEIEETLKADETKRLRKQFIDRLKKKAFIRYF